MSLQSSNGEIEIIESLVDIGHFEVQVMPDNCSESLISVRHTAYFPAIETIVQHIPTGTGLAAGIGSTHVRSGRYNQDVRGASSPVPEQLTTIANPEEDQVNIHISMCCRDYSRRYR